MREKITTEKELIGKLVEDKAAGKRIVFTNGCFDLIHVGHVRYLAEAKSLGEILVVAINSDRSVARLKGPPRPIVSEQERAEIIAALECVDYVTIFDEPDPYRIISVLKPNILVKGGDWTKETTVGRDVVEAGGGRVVVLPYVEGISTTGLMDRILQRCESIPKKRPNNSE
ncbi:MAG: D-glycero-beta-D-manno-heptose 1-phosphate adenylyltransferase [Proteobacteria bacterium]|nr:D-glycero-beta-D-manno-heptose 1-phosphate adenylyltransferase [Pseudomonadota bacterium]NIS70032.1 D-glycero-beta-D-manno-heptose 1-phosphate adenylyltransferase [Pseudomonadota bacterium]